jgi:hypothetical protein
MSHQDFVRETAYNYTEQREMLRWNFGTRNGADNISDIGGCFELFFDKEITQQIVRETYMNAEQYQKAQGSIFSFRSFVRSWTAVRINKIYSFMSVLKGWGWGWGGEISAMAFASVITGALFELICTYLYFTGTESVRTYQGLSKFSKMYSLLCQLNIKFRSLYPANQN